MSWFSSSIPSSPQHQDNDKEEEEQEESAGNSGQHLSPGKGVKEDFSELTKTFTRQLWGVASFLAPPPPSSQVESPKHGNAPETETQSHKIARDAEIHMDDTVFDGSEKPEGIKTSLEVPMFGVSREDVFSDTSKNGSPKVGGKKLTGFRSDLAELRGSMATGLSKIQSVIRVVTQDDEDESGHVVDSSPEGSSQSGSPKSPQDETNGSSSLGSLLKPLLGAVSPSQEGAPENRRQKYLSVSADHSEEDENNEIQHHKDRRPSAISSGIDGLSKFASSLIPLARDIVGEFSGRDYYAVGLTEEVVTFANSIAVHPETWLSFPLPEEEDDEDFEMTDAQQEHAEAVEQVASGFAAVRYELCPALISDGRFWKIYFVLLHSRLSKEDAELLSTSQVLKTRELLLQQLQQRGPMVDDTGPTSATQEGLGLSKYSIASSHGKDIGPEGHQEITAESKSSPIMEEEFSTMVLPAPAMTEEKDAPEDGTLKFASLGLDDNAEDVDGWLENEEDDKEIAGVHQGNPGMLDNVDEDVSFSDLEDDENETEHAKVFHLNKNDTSMLFSKTCMVCHDRLQGPVQPHLMTQIAVGVNTPSVQEGIDSIEGHSRSGDLPSDDDSSGSKTEREFNDWLTINEEDVASAGSSSP